MRLTLSTLRHPRASGLTRYRPVLDEDDAERKRRMWIAGYEKVEAECFEWLSEYYQKRRRQQADKLGK